MDKSRFLALVAGPFRLALPIVSIRQILDVGGELGEAPSDPRALGVLPLSLAELLGERATEKRPGLLLFDGHTGPVLLSCCRLDGFFEQSAVLSLPETVVTRWPGLVQSALVRRAAASLDLVLLLDPRVLMGLVEARMAQAPAAEPP